jgi:hypothetical protein
MKKQGTILLLSILTTLSYTLLNAVQEPLQWEGPITAQLDESQETYRTTRKDGSLVTCSQNKAGKTTCTIKKSETDPKPQEISSEALFWFKTLKAGYESQRTPQQ